MSRDLRFCAAVTTLAFLLSSAPARAVDHDWINTAGGFFQQTTNWDPVGVPGAGDRGVFNLNGAYTVSFFGDNTSARMTVARDNVTLDLNNSDYVLNSTGSTSFTVGVAGPLGGTGRLTIGEGTLSAQAGLIGTGAGTLVIGGTGTVTVTTGGALRFANALTVGSTRAGNVVVNGGADLFTVNTTVGLDAAGSVSVAGAGSSWAATSWTVVGGQAAGALNVTGGGIVTQSGAGAQGVVGDQSTAAGVVNIDGAGSRWTTAAEFFVGHAGDATVNLSNGGLLSTGAETFVANLSTSAANVTVGGGGAVLSTGSLLFGAGVGTVTINPDGRVQVAHAGLTRVTGASRINLAGGTLQTGSLQLANPSQLNWSSGTLHISNGSVIVNATGVLGANVSIGAGRALRVNDLFVSGGAISATGGGLVFTNRTDLGSNFSADGSITVSGAGSTWNSNDLNVGQAGNATLAISDGGRMISNSLSTAGIDIAGTSFSTSRVTVSGPGSSWDASSIPTGNGFVRVGRSGIGRLEVTGGALVTNDFTSVHVGSEAGSNGTAIVDGAGSRWDIGYDMLVGHFGNGSLAVTGGGTVSAASAFVGFAIPGHGTVSVGGAGSRLDVGTINVAHAGHGTLVVGTGGVVTGTRMVVSEDAFSDGLVRVDGGTLIAGASTTMGQGGRVQYDAGTFQAGMLAMNGPARVTLAPGRDKALETTALTMDAAGGSRIDLSDNFMIIDHGGASPLGDVADLVTLAYNGGAWDGNGLGSSAADASTHGVGFADSSSVFTSFPASFGGRTVDSTAVLIALTRYGDANLDGAVNLADFNRLAANFGSTDALWEDGDFTYDGVVNLNDFNRLAANFGLGAGPDGVVDPGDWAALAAAVPEPVGMIGLTLLWLSAYRRARR